MQVLIVVVPTFPCLIRQYSCTSIIVHIYVRTYLDHYILVRILPSYYSCVRVYYAPQVSIVRNTPWSQCSGVSRVIVFCASFGCGRVGLWADDSSRFSKKNKEKMPQPKHIESTGGKGKMPPETLTSAWGPTKKFERSK